MNSKTVYLPYRPNPQGNLVTQFNDANFDHVDSLKGFTRIFIQVTRMDRLSAQELVTMSKNKLREITLVIRPM